MKVALITGAASGIGLALSYICLQKGNIVVMVDKDTTKLIQEATQLESQFPNQVFHKSCDICQPDQIEQLLQFMKTQLGRIDWIYNNAGIIGHLAPVWELQQAHISQVMEVNLYGMINVIRTFMPFLFGQKHDSHIINMASLYALCSGSQLASYAMSKHAVLALTESLYFDLKRLEKSVNVSVVFPSFTDTSLLSNKSAQSDSPFHDTLNSLLSHSRPASDVAAHIVQEVEQKRFYILPDKEVKGYCEERSKSLVLQDPPYLNNIEKLIGSLLKRKKSLG